MNKRNAAKISRPEPAVTSVGAIVVAKKTAHRRPNTDFPIVGIGVSAGGLAEKRSAFRRMHAHSADNAGKKTPAHPPYEGLPSRYGQMGRAEKRPYRAFRRMWVMRRISPG